MSKMYNFDTEDEYQEAQNKNKIVAGPSWEDKTLINVDGKYRATMFVISKEEMEAARGSV